MKDTGMNPYTGKPAVPGSLKDANAYIDAMQNQAEEFEQRKEGYCMTILAGLLSAKEYQECTIEELCAEADFAVNTMLQYLEDKDGYDHSNTVNSDIL